MSDLPRTAPVCGYNYLDRRPNTNEGMQHCLRIQNHSIM